MGGGGAIVFEVADRGLGLSEDDLPRVFEPFFRAERSRSRGGRIELASRVGHGTRARVSVGPSQG